MRSYREHTVAEVEATLFGDNGPKLSDYFLVEGSPLFWQTGGPLDGSPMFMLIEIDELAEACKKYLREHGVPEYLSIDVAKASRQLPEQPS
jgi:hypothetical protein